MRSVFTFTLALERCSNVTLSEKDLYLGASDLCLWNLKNWELWLANVLRIKRGCWIGSRQCFFVGSGEKRGKKDICVVVVFVCFSCGSCVEYLNRAGRGFFWIPTNPAAQRSRNSVKKKLDVRGGNCRWPDGEILSLHIKNKTAGEKWPVVGCLPRTDSSRNERKDLAGNTSGVQGAQKSAYDGISR